MPSTRQPVRSRAGRALVSSRAVLEPMERRRLLAAAYTLVPLSGSNHQSGPLGISDDGSVVVGGWQPTSNATPVAFRWTAKDGMTTIDSNVSPFVYEQAAAGVSGDGKVVLVVSNTDAGGTFGSKSRLWTPTGGFTSFATSFGSTPSQDAMATAISSDGKVVTFADPGPGGQGLYRWTAAAGFQALGSLPGANPGGSPFGLNRDGSVIVGNASSRAGSTSVSQAFRWTAASGMQGLGVLPGEMFSTAIGVSDDGSVVAGNSGERAFRWTSTTGLKPLGTLPGGEAQTVEDVSGDGSTIIGRSGSDGYSKAFRWTASSGMQPLDNLVDAPGYTIVDAAAIGANGTIAVQVRNASNVLVSAILVPKAAPVSPPVVPPVVVPPVVTPVVPPVTVPTVPPVDASFATLVGNTLTVIGTTGDDAITLATDRGNVVVSLGAESKTFAAASVVHVNVSAGDGDDGVDASSLQASVYISGGSGDDTLLGGVGNDTLTGGAGRNRLFGGDGSDRLNGSNGRDFLYGQDGDDRLYGQGGNDQLDGGGGKDRLYGGDGDDVLLGGGSVDHLYGDAGDDTLVGGKSNDYLFGGDDADTDSSRDAGDILDSIEK